MGATAWRATLNLTYCGMIAAEHRFEHIYGMDAQHIPLNRLYGDLAHVWPLMSPPEEYVEEASHWKAILREKLGDGRHTLLDLGVGGGHNLSHFAHEFEVTAVDQSEEMLRNSTKLNPTVEHIVGDMRTVRLGRKFDAVTCHDAITYMLTEEDLRAAMQTASAHLSPGGVFIMLPDYFLETFTNPSVHHRVQSHDDTTFTYLYYAHIPDPKLNQVETIFTYYLRENGEVRVEHDRHITGIFPKATWFRLLDETGFDAEERQFVLSEPMKYTLLVASKR